MNLGMSAKRPHEESRFPVKYSSLVPNDTKINSITHYSLLDLSLKTGLKSFLEVVLLLCYSATKARTNWLVFRVKRSNAKVTQHDQIYNFKNNIFRVALRAKTYRVRHYAPCPSCTHCTAGAVKDRKFGTVFVTAVASEKDRSRSSAVFEGP